MSEKLVYIEKLGPNELLPDIADVQRRLLSLQASQAYNPDIIDKRQRDMAIYQKMNSILEALPSSWAENYPGKFKPHYSLINQRGREVIARDLLDIGAEDNIPPHKTVVNLDNVAKHPCPACGNDKAIIRQYQLTINGPEDNLCQTDELVMCLDDGLLVLRSETNSKNFYLSK